MPDYGLRVRDASGNITLDVDEKINRIAYTHEASASESDSAVVSSIDELLTVQIGFAINISNLGQCCHSIARSGTTISWTPNATASSGFYSNIDSLIMVFIYV
jgi:hypothetical protein